MEALDLTITKLQKNAILISKNNYTKHQIKFDNGRLDHYKTTRTGPETIQIKKHTNNIQLLFNTAGNLTVGKTTLLKDEYLILDPKAHTELIVLDQTKKDAEFFILSLDKTYYNLTYINRHTSHKLFMEINVVYILHEILRCEYAAKLKEIFVNAKIIELICTIENQLISQQEEYPIPLTDEILKSMYMARDILVSDLKANFTLQTLARQVGTNENYLKKHFKIAFGQPVFSYLNEYKMKLAKWLIIKQKLPINSVAANLGYKKPSNFSANFYRYYGFLPKNLKSLKSLYFIPQIIFTFVN